MRVLHQLDERRKTLKKARDKEIKDAKDFGAKLQPRSGGFYNMPGDSKGEKFLFDSKDTKYKSYSITEDVWEKLSSEALHSRRMPVLSIMLGNGQELVIMSKADFSYVREYFERYIDLLD